jgi:hypothetical protein
MADYKKLAEMALARVTTKKLLNESIVYPEGVNERMHSQLEKELATRRHSLGQHPAFPEDDETTFEQRIMGKRFDEVQRRYKRAFDVDAIDNNRLLKDMMPLVYETMSLESKHKKELEELAIRMIREEYDMDEDVVEIIAELTPDITLKGIQLNPKPMSVEDIEFNKHDDLVRANEEVYKRRFLNAMIQGAAKKCNHMFHMVDDDLIKLDPKLPNRYHKMMSAADYMYYVITKMEGTGSVNGGVVEVEYPSKNNPKAKIHAQAMVFPVLIHEIVKGVMELLSANGLPKDKKLIKYVTNKADFLAAEPWDMRLGPAIWERFTDAIDPDDFHLKHHVYSELVALPAREFHTQMKEIMAGTKEGKKIIKNIVERVKEELKNDEYQQALDEFGFESDENDETDIEDFL